MTGNSFVGGILEHEIENDPWALSLSTIIYQVDVDFIHSGAIRVIRMVFDTLYFDFASSAENVKTNASKILS